MPKFAKGLTFTDLGLKWSKRHSAFYSSGKLNLLNILNSNINVQLDGYLEIKKADGLDIVNLYIEASPDSWWHFGYDDQKRMGVVSSSSDFLDAVQDKVRPARGGSYYFEVAEESEKNAFLKHFRGDYLGHQINEADYQDAKPKEEAAEEGDEPKEEAASKPESEAGDNEYATDEEKAAAAKKAKKKKAKRKPTRSLPPMPPRVRSLLWPTTTPASAMPLRIALQKPSPQSRRKRKHLRRW